MLKQKLILRNFWKDFYSHSFTAVANCYGFKCNVCCPICKWTENHDDDDDDVDDDDTRERSPIWVL